MYADCVSSVLYLKNISQTYLPLAVREGVARVLLGCTCDLTVSTVCLRCNWGCGEGAVKVYNVF